MASRVITVRLMNVPDEAIEQIENAIAECAAVAPLLGGDFFFFGAPTEISNVFLPYPIAQDETAPTQPSSPSAPV